MYTPTEQCVLKFGDGSFDCRQNKYKHYCRQMRCYNTTSQRCSSAGALEGTSCMDGKLCKDGGCRNDATAPKVDDDCVYGDETGGEFEHISCSSIIQAFPGWCYNTKYYKNCCASCKKVYMKKKGCEYGDRYRKCAAAMCHYAYHEEKRLCCKTCNYTVPTNQPKATTVYTTSTISPTLTVRTKTTVKTTTVPKNIQKTN
ncbi:A disintegrin and metalloproteinase with thrombospondin motifs 15-like [Physella acuta]|uniref:A disintegrin and metalloproteinase with thrombospondin motifs 15-like n=1 Tax=Physella acuta TaxID=109671 RepID=UPI0027DC5D10|nr:A disintegrin and metalloproteinase with thrombospondin motifs 15-like [Physella acuta]